MRYRYISDNYSATCEILFSKVNNRYFEVHVKDPRGLLGDPFAEPSGKDGRVMVDRYMRNRGGTTFQMKALGPMWINAATRARGGKAALDFIFSGATTGEIKKWKKWDVFEVQATIFRGAVTGTWYYDRNTGFLVGFQQKTVATSFFTKNIPYWILVGTNIKGMSDSKPDTGEPSAVGSGNSAAQQDFAYTSRIILKNGKSMEGVIAKDEGDLITLELGGGSVSTTLNKKDIEAIEPVND